MESHRGHITEMELKAYIEKDMPPATLLSVDVHLESCDECMGRIRSEMEGTNAVALSEIFETDDEHLTFDQLAGHIDGTLDSVEKSIVELHLEDCRGCRSEAAEMARIRDEVEAKRGVTEHITYVADAPRRFGWKMLVPAFGAAIVLIALWALLPTIGPKFDPNITSVQPPEIKNWNVADPQPPDPNPDDNNSTVPDESELTIAIVDAGGKTGIARDGSLVGYESAPPRLRQAAKDALASGTIRLGEQPPAAGTSALMGNREGVPFGLIGPVGKAVLAQRPALSWKPLSGAESYVVKIFDENFGEVAASPGITTPSWTPTAPLARGKTYSWQVTAIKDGGELKSPVRPAPDAQFRVVDAASAEDVFIAERQFANANLVRAVAYARAGLKDEAIRELNILARKNPGSAVVRRLLQNVRNAR